MNRRSFFKRMFCGVAAVVGLPLGEGQKRSGTRYIPPGTIDAWLDDGCIISSDQKITGKCLSDNIVDVDTENQYLVYLNVCVHGSFSGDTNLVIKIKCSNSPSFDQNTKVVFKTLPIKGKNLLSGTWLLRRPLRVITRKYIGLEYELIPNNL